MRNKSILFDVVNENALAFQADILVLKYARALYGLDRAVYAQLTSNQRDRPLPEVWQAVAHDMHANLRVDRVMFVGVPPLNQLRYAALRRFGLTACHAIKDLPYPIRHIALTVHGPGYGLDENEAFESVLGGILEALQNGQFPEQAERISFVELDQRRAERLRAVLLRRFPDGRVHIGTTGSVDNLGAAVERALRTAGAESERKPTVFVAMPFAESKTDTYHYGIQGAVHRAGWLCERADMSTFVGDVNAWVKDKIKNARLVIADLSDANPNVYLEVGYAWGCGIPTVLLCDSEESLKFDVRGQRCLLYKSIKDLEEKLSSELQVLLSQ